MLSQSHHKAFTLAELLIALAVLGVIATFAIPKIITAQQNASNLAKAKEAASMISGAYSIAQVNGTMSSGSAGSTMSQYLNYVSVVSSGSIDDRPGGTSYDCASSVCLKLHNGGILLFRTGESFGGVASNNGIPIIFDPDGVYSGSSSDGPGKSIIFVLFYNGKLTSFSQQATFTSSAGMIGNGPDPSWFSW